MNCFAPRNNESVANKITEGDKIIIYNNSLIEKEETKELMKLSLTWSLPNGETPPNMNLMAIFFTKAGQGVCQMSETQSGDGEKKIFLPPWHTIPYHTIPYHGIRIPSGGM